MKTGKICYKANETFYESKISIMRKRVWITAIIVALIMGLIFFFSSQDSDDSSETSGFFTDIAISIFHPDFESYSIEEKAAVYEEVDHVVRKVAHFTEYAMLGAALMVHALMTSRKKYWLHGLICLLIGASYAATDELHQSFVGGRAMMFTDVCIDSSGVLFGVLVVMLIYHVHKLPGMNISA